MNSVNRVLDAVAAEAEVEVPDVMVDEKVDEMIGSFERSIRSQGIEPEQYYQIAGVNLEDMKERVKPDAADTVKKELVLDSVVAAESIEADEHALMHEVGHLAEESGREPQEIVEAMRQNGTYSLLEEELARQKALDFLAENVVAVPMPEEEEEEATEAVAGEPSIEAGEETPGADEEPESGEATVETSVEVGGDAENVEQTIEGEEK